jgi:hypothetical protein
MKTRLILVLACVPSLALADERIHDYATLDRASGASEAGADLSFVMGLGDMSGAVSRLDLHGSYMHPSGFGAYGGLAVSKGFVDGNGDPILEGFADAMNDTALGNLELGGQYKRVLRDDLSVVAHVGLSLPTASDESIFTNLISIQHRINDTITAIPNVTAARLGVSPMWQRGALFARADLGVDVVIDEPEMASLNTIGHANLAIGARQGKIGGALELVTMANLGEKDEGDDRVIHSAALSLRYDAGVVAPTVNVVSPLDDASRGETISIGAGVAGSF